MTVKSTSKGFMPTYTIGCFYNNELVNIEPERKYYGPFFLEMAADLLSCFELTRCEESRTTFLSHKCQINVKLKRSRISSS